MINNSSPSITGVLTSFSIFVYRSFNGNKNYEYWIPLVCGGICTLLTIYIVEKIKNKKERKSETEKEKLKAELREKQENYTELMQKHEEGSELRKTYSDKIEQLISMDFEFIIERKTKIKDLDQEILEAESMQSENAKKISELNRKEHK